MNLVRESFAGGGGADSHRPPEEAASRLRVCVEAPDHAPADLRRLQNDALWRGGGSVDAREARASSSRQRHGEQGRTHPRRPSTLLFWPLFVASQRRPTPVGAQVRGLSERLSPQVEDNEAAVRRQEGGDGGGERVTPPPRPPEDGIAVRFFVKACLIRPRPCS